MRHTRVVEIYYAIVLRGRLRLPFDRRMLAEFHTTQKIISRIHGKRIIKRPVGANLRPPPLARVVRSSAIYIVGVPGIEGLLQLLGLVQIKLLLDLEDRLSGQSTAVKSESYHFHCDPFLAQNLTDLAGPHGLILGRYLRSPPTSEYHECIHGALGGAIRVESL